jgi:hypothetical protein
VIVIFFLANWGVPELIAWLVGLIIGSFIMSAPLVSVNYKIASTYILKNNKKTSIRLLTACNHLVTYIVYLIIFLMILYWGN